MAKLSRKLEKDTTNPRWPGLWPEIVHGQKIFSMARGVPIWPDLKNLAIKWPGWQHWFAVHFTHSTAVASFGCDENVNILMRNELALVVTTQNQG